MKIRRPEDAELRQLALKHSTQEIAEQYGVSMRAVQYWKKSLVGKTPPPEFLDLKEPELDWRKALDLASQVQELDKQAHVGQHEASIQIKADKPIAVMFTADWHLGSLATDHKSFLANIEYVFETDGLYLGVVGDEIDNFSTFRSAKAVLDQVLHPETQKKVLREILAELVEAGKLLWTAWGNHNEEFDERCIGHSLRDLLYDTGVPHLVDDGRVHLKVGDQQYSILARHKARGHSSHNRLWAAKQLYRREWPADIVIVAHTHVGDFETYRQYDKQNFLFQLGTFKTDDIYSRRYWGGGSICTPAVVLSPKEREIVPFLRADQAVRYMTACWQ